MQCAITFEWKPPISAIPIQTVLAMINNGAHISGSAKDIALAVPAVIDNTIDRSERKK
jgi:hypothetical protein